MANYLIPSFVLMSRTKDFKVLTDDQVLERLDQFKVQGFDSLRIPGGTSITGEFYAGTIIGIYDSLVRRIYFLGVPYDSEVHLNQKNGHNKKEKELPNDVALRETEEETGIRVNLDYIDLILTERVKDNRKGMEGKFHYKTFYSVEKFSGKLLEFEGSNPLDPETAAPLWIPAEIFVSKLFKGHLEAVRKVIEELSKDREYAYALMNVPRF